MSDEVGSVEKRSRARWLVPSVVVAAVLAASAAAGWVAWGNRDRSPKALPDDFCAFVLPLLEDAMPDARAARDPAPLTEDGTTSVFCEVRELDARGALTGNVSIRVERMNGDREAAIRRARDRYDELRSRSSYSGVGEEASGFAMAKPVRGYGHPATLFLQARGATDILHLEYTLQPSTEDEVQAAGTEFAGALLDRLAG